MAATLEEHCRNRWYETERWSGRLMAHREKDEKEKRWRRGRSRVRVMRWSMGTRREQKRRKKKSKRTLVSLSFYLTVSISF